LLIEALFALVIASIAAVSMFAVSLGAFAMADASIQLDLADQSAAAAAATALRAPCGAVPSDQDRQLSARHRSLVRVADGAVRVMQVNNQWPAIGTVAGWHDTVRVAAHLGVRCD
jgi:hypothetical protein